MEYFKKYTSNTLAGSGSQYFFNCDNENAVHRGRVYYKIFCGGEYDYSFLLTNIIDSTFGEGRISHKNLIIDSWKIIEASVGLCSECSESEATEPRNTYVLTFDGEKSRTVNPGEFFCSDPVRLCGEENEYICFEIAFSGKIIPNHEESIIPTFVLNEDNKWVPSKLHPFLSMVGCNRSVKKKICFLGDSITQGIGTEINSYAHWNAVLAERLGTDYSFWNLGLGYGRADDAATDGAWLFKAKQADIAFVCFGVNDILNGFSEESIKKNLVTVTEKLKSEGIKVILQTVPPFNYDKEKISIWKNVNKFIKEELSKKVDKVFDVADLLKKSDSEPHMAAFGGHPNAEGCAVWAERLYHEVKEFF